MGAPLTNIKKLKSINYFWLLYLEVPNIKAEINSVREEAREQRETLHAELVEIKEVTKQQAVNIERLAIAAETQAEIAKAQA